MEDQNVIDRPQSVIALIEQALEDHLKTSVSGQCLVRSFPADPGQFDFSNLPAALLIHYGGSRYAEPHGPANTTQARSMEFVLVLLCRSLREEGGAYRHLEDIRLAVQGRPFAGSGPARIVRDALDSEQAGVWRWSITIQLPIPAVARSLPPTLLRPMITP